MSGAAKKLNDEGDTLIIRNISSLEQSEHRPPIVTVQPRISTGTQPAAQARFGEGVEPASDGTFTEQHAHRHVLKRLGIIMLVGLLAGGVAAVVLVKHRNNLHSLTPPPIAIEKELPKLKAVTQNSTTTQAQPMQSQVASHKELSVEEFAQQQEVRLETRKYLFTSGKQRSYAPLFTLEDQPAQKEPVALSVRGSEFQQVPGSAGRFKVGEASSEWQGNWKLNNPEFNIKLGDQYQQYLKKTFDEQTSPTLTSALSSVSRGSSDLLGRVAKPVGAPISPR